MGINARKSLHPQWVNHHVRTIDGFKNCTVQILRRVPGVDIVYNKVTRTYDTGTYTEIYTGEARLQPYGINLDLENGNDPTARRLVLAQLQGKDTGVTTDDILHVIAAENNTDLLLYDFDIRGAIGSSMEWGTNLVMEVNLKVAS
jgi:hypothetical protein